MIMLKHLDGNIAVEAAGEDMLSIDGVLVSAEVLRTVFVAPDPTLYFACERNGNAVHARMKVS